MAGMPLPTFGRPTEGSNLDRELPSVTLNVRGVTFAFFGAVYEDSALGVNAVLFSDLDELPEPVLQ